MLPTSDKIWHAHKQDDRAVAGVTDAGIAALVMKGGLVLHPHRYLRYVAPHGCANLP